MQRLSWLQVVQEVFCWSRNPMEVRRLCARKEELYAALAGNHKPPVVPGVPLFLETLVKHNVSLPGLLYYVLQIQYIANEGGYKTYQEHGRHCEQSSLLSHI